MKSPQWLSSFWSKIREAWNTSRVLQRLAESQWPKRFAERSIALAEKWKLRERFVKILPSDLASTLPSTLDPSEIAQWVGQAFQKQGADYYLKLITVVVCSYYLADLTALLAERFIPEPAPVRVSSRSGGQRIATKKTINDYSIIFTRNLFNSQGIIPGEDNGGADMNGAPTRTTLPLNLIGTLIFEDSLRSIATIEDKTANLVYPVRADDEVPSKIKIISIESRKVIFKNLSSGRKEYVELPADPLLANNRITLAPKSTSKAPGIEQVAGNQFNISRTEVDKTLSDLNNVLTQARAVPHFENGAPAGYKLYQIVPGSIYEKLGLLNGDTICGLNGQPMSDPGKAFEMLNELKTSSHLELCIKRDGKQSNFAYDIR